jgi:hypothetical protein
MKAKYLSSIIITTFVIGLIGVVFVQSQLGTQVESRGISLEIISSEIGFVQNGMIPIEIAVELDSNKEFEVRYGCSTPFWAKTSADELEIMSGDFLECIQTHELPSGKSTYTFNDFIKPINPEFDLSSLSLLEIQVVLGNNNIISSNYVISIIQPDVSLEVVNTKNGSILDDMLPIEITVELDLDLQFDVEYGCSTPFWAKTNSDQWKVLSGDFLDCVQTFEFSSGKSTYTFNDFIKPVDPETDLSSLSSLEIQVVLGNNLLISSEYLVTLS